MQLTSVLSSMDPHDDDAASVVTVTKTVVVSHGEDTPEEQIEEEGIHLLQTGRGVVEGIDVARKE